LAAINQAAFTTTTGQAELSVLWRFNGSSGYTHPSGHDSYVLSEPDMPQAAMSASPLSRLLARLDLDQRADDVFAGEPGQGEGPLFGGFVAAQAVVAAARTVDGTTLHSLHAYFLEPGRHGAPIEYSVERLRNGRTFVTRQVVARQDGAAIFSLTASFARIEPGISHQDPMPEAPPPDGLPEWEDVRLQLLRDPSKRRPDGPLEVRVCDPDSADPDVRLPPSRRVWLRARGEVPADPLSRLALLVFASDRTLLRTGARPHGLPWERTIGVSLDHAVWLHRLPRFDDWILYACHSPAAEAARSLTIGAMYERDGTRIATVAQEGLLRLRRGQA
jgi:acyl-CoA thioesterase-2